MTTRKNKSQVICYSGIKSRKNGIHTIKQFLHRVNPEKLKPHSYYKSFISKSSYDKLKSTDNAFRAKSLDEKMKIMGATWEDRDICITKNQKARKTMKMRFNALSNPKSAEFKKLIKIVKNAEQKIAYKTYKRQKLRNAQPPLS